ncbi:VWA domain-containing protein [Tropicimonas sp. IMCC34011]|uniref:vWA domain-containing protein n=1 Tax=Tropicimonas sp. IMCC34011 TaxID=2248759 RepID=UPI000E2619F7|nr:VWA domain-containing protein [Tropicimonas sp. IMCC34011]
MARIGAPEIPEHGRLAENVAHFARALRAAGLKVGPGRVSDAVRAVEAAGFSDRRDFYWVLHACFVSRPEERTVFAQAFRLFWRDPRYLEHMMALLVPSVRGLQEERAADPGARRAAEALTQEAPPPPQDHAGSEDVTEIDARATASADERLRSLDFAQMSADEMRAAERAVSRMALGLPQIQSRRMRADRAGRSPDWRRVLAASARRGGEIGALPMRKKGVRPPDLVALCDISGSMSEYSRIVLHFLHAVSNRRDAGWGRVHAFTFGTRLTNITRHLDRRDVDAALSAAGREAADWEGGTRIAESLAAFNRDWSRRVLARGAIVLLITDGLERGAPDQLARQMERLRLSARRVIWVNPLLRFDGFSPRAAGIRSMLPHVDSFRAGHSIRALEDLASVLAGSMDAGERGRLMAMLRAAQPTQP